MRFANGVIGTIDNSRKAVYGYDQRVEVFGSGGSVRSGNDYPNTTLISDATSVHRDLPLNFFMDRYVEAYVEELRTFIACIREDRVPPVTGMDGRQSILMGYAARKSFAEHRPVRLSEVG